MVEFSTSFFLLLVYLVLGLLTCLYTNPIKSDRYTIIGFWPLVLIVRLLDTLKIYTDLLLDSIFQLVRKRK